MKIWLIRHAKSDWGDAGLRDFDRPLNKRGRRDGPVMAAWLAEQSDPAGWIWTSAAARAQATTAFVRDGFQTPEDRVVALDELYHAGPEGLLDVLRRTPGDIDSVALVAHNPGLTWLSNSLGRERVTVNLPTFGVVRFDHSGPWADLREGAATVDFCEGPKSLAAR